MLWKHPGNSNILGLQIGLKLLKLLGEETILTDWAGWGKGLWEVEEGGRFLSKESVDLT
jgi:hypothetical protein